MGLVAGKLADEFGKPAFVITVSASEARGSARSHNSNFHITNFLTELEELLIKFGGHKSAAGFSIEPEKIELFFEKVKSLSNTKSLENFETLILIDAEIEFDEIGNGLYDFIKRLEPCGAANPTPVFLTRNVKVVEAKKVGSSQNHLRLKVSSDSCKFEGLVLVWAIADNLFYGEVIDIVYEIIEEEWQKEDI